VGSGDDGHSFANNESRGGSCDSVNKDKPLLAVTQAVRGQWGAGARWQCKVSGPKH
jgi:hypothetical protein